MPPTPSRPRVLATAAAALVLLPGCASRSGSDTLAVPPASTPPASSPSAASSSAGATRLVVEARADASAAPTRAVLTCDPPGGDLPDPSAACAALTPQALWPLPPDRACTEIYGGPQTARVTGTVRGEAVDLDLSRDDGCQISRWDALAPLLPPVG